MANEMEKNVEKTYYSFFQYIVEIGLENAYDLAQIKVSCTQKTILACYLFECVVW